MKLVNPKNGEVLTSKYATNAKALKALAKKLLGSLKGNDFANSIYDKCLTEKGQTPARLFWLHKLANESPKPKTAIREVDLSGLCRMLETAKASGLKFPKVTLHTKSGVEVTIKIAGAKSKYTGSLMLSSGSYRNGNYYGRVTDGKLFEGKDITQEVVGLLVDLSTDPEGTAARMGRMTGNCCFCGRKLTTATSIALGYGATCAKKYGLKHSKSEAAAKKKKAKQFVEGELDLGLPSNSGKPRRVTRRRNIERV